MAKHNMDLLSGNMNFIGDICRYNFGNVLAIWAGYVKNFYFKVTLKQRVQGR